MSCFVWCPTVQTSILRQPGRSFTGMACKRTPARTSAPTVTASGVLTKVSMELSGLDTENLWQVPSHLDDVAEVRENDKEGSHYRMAYRKSTTQFLAKAFNNNTIWIESQSEPV